MAGSTFGNHFKITTWGESHGRGIGVVIDGCPAGLSLDETDIQKFLDRRKPGQSKFSTQRKEADSAEILSGIFEGKTTGTPISLLVFNKDQHSKDYGEIANYYRPGHADYTFDMKYGFRDYRGGGRSSGRETIGRVAAGAVAAKILKQLGVTFLTYARSIGPVSISSSPQELLSGDLSELSEKIQSSPLYMPEELPCQQAQEFLQTCMADKNSAVKGFEIGGGFAAAAALGSENNDSFERKDREIRTATNHAGGVLGGISNGMPIIFRAAVKPTPSIASLQNTITRNGEPLEISIHGRHDPIIVPRAVVVVESMAALTLLDLMMEQMGSRMESLEGFYKTRS